jgi:hypothetical protein
MTPSIAAAHGFRPRRGRLADVGRLGTVAGQGQPKGGAGSDDRPDGQFRPEQNRGLGGDRQAQAQAGLAVGITALEGVEDVIQLVGGDAGAFVGDG